MKSTYFTEKCFVNWEYHFSSFEIKSFEEKRLSIEAKADE